MNERGIISFYNFRRKIYNYFFLILEIMTIFRIDNRRYMQDYREKIILGELKIINPTPYDKILFIGCGLIPSTPIVIYKKTKNMIETIDKNKLIVKFAKRLIDKKKLADNIIVRYGDGKTFPVGKYDVIIIATNTFPIEGILDNIWRNMKPTAKIICRNIKNDIETLLNHKKFQDKFEIKDVFKHPGVEKYRSLLLLKKSK